MNPSFSLLKGSRPDLQEERKPPSHLKYSSTLSFSLYFVLANESGIHLIGHEQEKKDKIGERVAALQHLVSPFGKTDTASVLKEAASYIKFLQDQLDLLSTPYLGFSPNSKSPEEEKRYSLRHRGLCLMPVDETVHFVRSNGADIWAPISK
ncbi:hypothetical protein M5K25_020921 [Dendrobium thyrsiflorum]|uniref:BHLH domain-containing protein n=1 Tax=Dendrobium thyrsiflorum TaxID=117978 RepID=A0ABD0UB88_DENTH